MSKDEGREMFYGMPYADWRAQHQTEATDDQKSAFKRAFEENVGTGE